MALCVCVSVCIQVYIDSCSIKIKGPLEEKKLCFLFLLLLLHFATCNTQSNFSLFACESFASCLSMSLLLSAPGKPLLFPLPLPLHPPSPPPPPPPACLPSPVKQPPLTVHKFVNEQKHLRERKEPSLI